MLLNFITKAKKSVVSRIVLFILAAVMFMGLLPGGMFAPLKASATEPPPGAPKISLKWTSNGSVTGSWTDLTLTPSNNSQQTVTLLLNFQLAEGTSAAPGEIEIRIPRNVFVLGGNGRTGSLQPSPNYAMGLGAANQNTHPSGYRYTIDASTGEFVITNYNAIDAAQDFNCEIAYYYMPYQIQDGYTKTFNAAYKLGNSSSGFVTGSTGDVSIMVNTGVTAGNLEKSQQRTYETWPSNLDTAQQALLPAGTSPSDYVYLAWKVRYTTSYTCTQPHHVDIVEDYAALNEYGGIVVGAYTFSGNAGESNRNYDPARYIPGIDTNTLSLQKPPVSLYEGTDIYFYKFFIIAYPRAEIATHDNLITNKVHAELRGIDGAYADVNVTQNYEYTEAARIVYPGDLYTMTKGPTAVTVRNMFLDLLLDGHSVPVQEGGGFSVFRTYNTARAWSLTQQTGLSVSLNQSVADGASLPPNSTVTYTGTITNNSGQTWDQPSVTLTLRSGFTVVSGSVKVDGVPVTEGRDYNVAGSPPKLAIGFDDIASGGIATFEFTIKTWATSFSTATPLTSTLGGAFGKLEYTQELVDDMVFIGNTQLQPGDYSFSKFHFEYVEYDAFVDERGAWSRVESNDYANYSPVTVYVKTESNPAVWQEVGTCLRTGAYTYEYTPSGGSPQLINSSNKVFFPEKTFAIKYAHTSKRYEVQLRADFDMDLHPTDRIKGFVEQGNNLTLRNISTMLLIDSAGNYRNIGSGIITSTTGIDDQVIAYDTAQGRPVNDGHALYGVTLQRIAPTTTINKLAGTPTHNQAQQWSEVPYSISIYDNLAMLAFPPTASVDDLRDAGRVPNLTSGAFYDLLPAGASVMPGSITVRKIFSATTVGRFLTSDEIQVEMVNNWQGSGRTMLIVRVALPEGEDNYLEYRIDNGTVLYGIQSGFILAFTLINPFTNITDNGTNIRNLVAYRSKSPDHLGSGRQAEIIGGIDYRYFQRLESDVRDDGNKDTVYAYHDAVTAPVYAGITGLTKRVRAEGEPSFKQSTTTFATGTYTYQLRYETGMGGGTQSDLVIYDVLEDYSGPEPHWEGTFEGIDVSHAVSRGIAPVVYYSTTSGLNPFISPMDGNLVNFAIWSTTPPADLSTVTAIAIDLRTGSDGQPFVMTNNTSVNCLVHMRAPAGYEAIGSDLAYNRASYQAQQEFDVGHPTLSTGRTEWTTVGLRGPNLPIVKSSDPESGTDSAPADIYPGNTLEYTVKVTNNESVAVDGIEVTDTIPEYLTIDSGNIKYCFGSAEPQPVTGATPVRVVQNGQELTFTIDRLLQKQSLSLVIPTMVNSDVADRTRIVNGAAVSKLNGLGLDKTIESNKTYHIVPDDKVYADVVISGEKAVNGVGAPGKEFTFTLTQVKNAQGDAWDPPEEAITRETSRIGEGEFFFPVIEGLTPGVYYFVMQETPGSEKNWRYDDTKYLVIVKVENTGNPPGVMIDGKVLSSSTKTS